LAGIKPANLVSFSVARRRDCRELIALYNEALNGKDIFFEILRERDGRCLLLAFRGKKLSARLADPECKAILAAAGYPDTTDLSILLVALKERVAFCPGFPHEIGVFLGYPAEDVIGFLKHRGGRSLYAGYWKVYGDVEEKKLLFRKYDRCRNAIIRRIDEGFSIAALFAGGVDGFRETRQCDSVS
jgi:hypothetical protein